MRADRAHRVEHTHVGHVRVEAIRRNVNGMLSSPCMFFIRPCVYAPFNTCDSDKYVSRSEFDDLKARFDRLEAVVGRMQQINAAGPAPGDMPTGSNTAIFAPQLADRGAYPPAAFNQPIAGPSHRTDPESAYAEAYRHPTQSPVTSSGYPAPYPLRPQQQRASSPAPPPAMLPPPEQGGSPSGYITGKLVSLINTVAVRLTRYVARRPSGSEVHFTGRVPGRSPPIAGGSGILAPPPQGYMQSPSRGLPPNLGAEGSEHPTQMATDVRASSRSARRASTASISAPPRPHGSVSQLPPPPGGERDPRYRER